MDNIQHNHKWNPKLYEANHGFVWRYGEDLIKILAPTMGERILDIGCGTGHLTAKIGMAGAETSGIDNAPNMVARARENYPHLHFEVASAAELPYDCEFDAVFSNAAIHWMRPPEQVAGGILRSLRPDGRLVAEFGGEGNVRAITDSMARAIEGVGGQWFSPWYFPSQKEYANLLSEHGFEIRNISLRKRPTSLSGGEDGLQIWLAMFGQTMLATLSEEQKNEVLNRVEQDLRPSLMHAGTWVADYVRLRVQAIKPT